MSRQAQSYIFNLLFTAHVHIATQITSPQVQKQSKLVIVIEHAPINSRPIWNFP